MMRWFFQFLVKCLNRAGRSRPFALSLREMVVVSSYGAVPVSTAEAPAEATRSSTTALKIASAVMAGLMVAVLVVAVSTNAQVIHYYPIRIWKWF
jgi:hypothetical protein